MGTFSENFLPGLSGVDLEGLTCARVPDKNLTATLTENDDETLGHPIARTSHGRVGIPRPDLHRYGKGECGLDATGVVQAGNDVVLTAGVTMSPGEFWNR